MASLFQIVKKFLGTIVKNPIKSAIIAYLVWTILKKQGVEGESVGLCEGIRIYKQSGQVQLIQDTDSGKFAVLRGTKMNLFDKRPDADKDYAQALKGKELFDPDKTFTTLKDKYGREAITLDIEEGDTLLGGKFRNKKIKVKSIDKNERGEPTVNGKPILSVRLTKLQQEMKR